MSRLQSTNALLFKTVLIKPFYLGGKLRYLMDTQIPPDIERLSVKYRKGFYSYVQSNSKQKLTSKQKEGLNLALKIFLHNCVLCSYSKRKDFVISLSRDTYTKAPIRNGVRLKTKVSYTHTRKVLEFFESKNLIVVSVGYVKDWNATKKMGKWEFNPEYVPSIVTLKHTFRDICKSFEMRLESLLQINSLILRDENKCDLPFKKTKERSKEIQNMYNFNVRALDCSVTKIDNDDTHLIQIRKIYNKDFYHGGRLFDYVIQCMPKAERAKLVISGERVVLLDYKSFETSLAYTLCDEVMDGDPYMIDFEEYHPKVVRDVCKLIMTRIYNVDNRKTLVYLVNEHIRENFNLDKLVKERKIPEKRIPVGLFVDILLDKHDAIQDYFFNKGEYNLQYVGSQIMDYIVEKVMQNHPHIIIPVFDEVICGVSIKNDVKQYMEDAYTKVLGCKLNCKVEEEGLISGS